MSADPTGRVSIAFGQPTLLWAVDWTAIDEWPNLVTSYTVDRGRQYELDRTDTGRATVAIADPDGILDPTNPGGPYYTQIEPLLRIALARWNPVAAEWQTRFRGFIEDLDYRFDPSQRLNRLAISCVDLFEIVSAIQLQPGEFGDTPPAASSGQVFFDNANCDDRILQVLTDALGAPAVADWAVVLSGNVTVHETVYSPGESAMTAVQEAADAEFPGVSNVYVDRFGRLAFHGRLAKFDPVGTASTTTPDRWDFLEVAAGDHDAVLAELGTVAQIRRFGFNRGLAKVINQATASPVNIADAAVAGQLVQDTASISQYGIRSWSAQNLITETSLFDDATDLVETKRFASYYKDNYASPRDRITDFAVQSIQPGSPGASPTWDLLSRLDIADQVTVTVGSPGGGGFDHVHYFVEGIHEDVQPLGAPYDLVTMTLDLSPRVYFDSNPWT